KQGYGQPGHRYAPAQMIDPGVLPGGGYYSEGNAHRDGQHHRSPYQLQGRGKKAGQVLRDGATGSDGTPQVALQQAGQVADVLDGQRLIQPVSAPDLGYRLIGRSLARQ